MRVWHEKWQGIGEYGVSERMDREEVREEYERKVCEKLVRWRFMTCDLAWKQNLPDEWKRAIIVSLHKDNYNWVSVSGKVYWEGESQQRD